MKRWKGFCLCKRQFGIKYNRNTIFSLFVWQSEIISGMWSGFYQWIINEWRACVCSVSVLVSSSRPQGLVYIYSKIPLFDSSLWWVYGPWWASVKVTTVTRHIDLPLRISCTSVIDGVRWIVLLIWMKNFIPHCTRTERERERALVKTEENIRHLHLDFVNLPSFLFFLFFFFLPKTYWLFWLAVLNQPLAMIYLYLYKCAFKRYSHHFKASL